MAYNMSKMTILKATDPKRWHATMSKAITKHRGVAIHIAQDMGVGISTFKRWVESDHRLERLLVRTRKATRGKPKPKAA